MIKELFQKRATNRRAYIFGAVLMFLGLFNLYFIVFEPEMHPQLVLFLFFIPSNSAISLFPHEPVLVRYGQLHPLLLTTTTATLSTMLAGYLDWHVFVPLLNSQKLSFYRTNRFYRFCIDHFKKSPFVWLLIAGFSPVPHAAFKFLTFSIRYPLGKYIASLAISRFPRYYILVWLGYTFSIPGWVLITIYIAIFALTLRQTIRGNQQLKLKKERL